MLFCCLNYKRKSMLNNLLLIIVMILSLSLAFYCVDSHKNNILSMVHTEVNTNEKNLTKQEITPIKPIEKIYVEELAVEDENKISKPEPQTTEKVKKVIEKIEPQEKIIPIAKTVPIEKIEYKAERKSAVKNKTVSEYDEGYKLDELEKTILEELKKENKD